MSSECPAVTVVTSNGVGEFHYAPLALAIVLGCLTVSVFGGWLLAKRMDR